MKKVIQLSLAVAAALSVHASMAGQQMHTNPYVNVTVGGELKPGVYGRVDIGNHPPPPVYSPQPVVIAQQAVVVPAQPVYVYAPPGHRKKWAKHCGHYNACGHPVYFVRVDERPRAHAHPSQHGRGHGHGRGHDERGHGHGH